MDAFYAGVAVGFGALLFMKFAGGDDSAYGFSRKTAANAPGSGTSATGAVLPPVVGCGCDGCARSSATYTQLNVTGPAAAVTHSPGGWFSGGQYPVQQNSTPASGISGGYEFSHFTN